MALREQQHAEKRHSSRCLPHPHLPGRCQAVQHAQPRQHLERGLTGNVDDGYEIRFVDVITSTGFTGALQLAGETSRFRGHGGSLEEQFGRCASRYWWHISKTTNFLATAFSSCRQADKFMPILNPWTERLCGFCYSNYILSLVCTHQVGNLS